MFATITNPFFALKTYVRLEVLFFLVAPIFALTTWQAIWPSVLFYALPVVAFQIAVLILGIRAGFSLTTSINRSDKIALAAAMAWMASTTLSSILAPYDPAQALFRHYSSVVSLLFTFMLCVMFSKDWIDARNRVLLAVGWGTVVYSLILFIMVINVFEQSNFRWELVAAGTTNFRQLGFYGLTLAGIGSGLFVTTDNWHIRISSAVFLFFGILVTFWSGGRAAFGGLILALGAACVLGNTGSRPQFLTLSAMMAVIAAPISELLAPSDEMGILRILSRSVEVGGRFTSGRSEMWLATIEAIRENWLFGFGEGQFRGGVEESRGAFNHPHNFILQFLYQWGVVGTLAITALIMRVFWNARRHIMNERTIRLPAFATLLGLTSMALLEGSFFHTFPIMISLTCVALLTSRNPHLLDSKI